MHAIYKRFPLFALVITLGLAPLGTLAQSARVDELRTQINQRGQQIADLEKEIKIYQTSLQAASQKANTLKNELTILETERKKLAAEIKVTENKIYQTGLNIEKLSLEIGNKDDRISQLQSSLRVSLRKLRAAESENLVEILLAQDRFSKFVANQERFLSLQDKVNTQISKLRELRVELTDQKAATEAEKMKLVTLNNKLADQKKIADQNKKEKDRLLTQTKNTEEGYRKILADRQARKEAFERELFQLESELKIAIDRSLLPSTGSKALAWPLDNIFITQYFGKTVDAKRLYASGTHNGIDLRASIGTPVKTAAGGTVTAIGDTDTQPGCYSYGKWVLIKHNNGLSTLYGHLSLIKVKPNQSVSVGEIIAYSGNTGYSTGPHLHFTVYATQGVRVQQYVTSNYCKNVTVPIADPKAYLDPMDYL